MVEKLNYFKKCRVLASLSQKQVADELGFSGSQFVSNVERGKSTYAPDHVKKLAKMFGVTEREVKREIFKFRAQKEADKLGL